MSNKTLQEYQEDILKLQAEVANISVKISKLRKEAAEIFFPHYKYGTRVRFEFGQKERRSGKIVSAELDRDNPFRVRVEIKPTNKNFSKINKVVVHPIYVDSSKIVEIVSDH